MKILYTGFAPFGGESVNPSFESLRLLPDSIAGADVLRLELPTSFDSAGKLLVEGIARERPDIVICVGQAGGRAAVTPEFVAINYRSARIPDNDGFQPTDEPVCGGGPVGYFTKLPVRRIAERCRENGIPVNDGTMVELLDLCDYLKLDFASYFPGYEPPAEFAGFAGNY